MLAKARGWLGAITVSSWFVLMAILSAGLLARHVVALPAPALDANLATELGALRTPGNRGKWLAIHVLYAECRCSQRIADHLVETERPVDWAEVVLWVGHPAPSAALANRFDVRSIRPSDLARYGIESAPMLFALDPAGRIRYAGGYSERKQASAIDDLLIFRAARNSGPIARLPVFGCAVSDRLKRELSLLPVP